MEAICNHISAWYINMVLSLLFLNNFKSHVETVLGLREFGVNGLEFKLFRLARATGANDCQNYATYTQEQF